MLKIILLILAIAFTPILAQAQTQAVSFELTWTDNSGKAAPFNDEEDGFKIERRIGAAGTFAEIAKVGRNVTSYIDTLAAAGSQQEYCYQVRAFNSAGDSPYSNQACATTPVIIVVPPGPGNLLIKIQIQ